MDSQKAKGPWPSYEAKLTRFRVQEGQWVESRRGEGIWLSVKRKPGGFVRTNVQNKIPGDAWSVDFKDMMVIVSVPTYVVAATASQSKQGAVIGQAQFPYYPDSVGCSLAINEDKKALHQSSRAF
ncbi:hypothetical protein AJ78_04772, partial [Emergomyces pasteurianus Ep9510]